MNWTLNLTLAAACSFLVACGTPPQTSPSANAMAAPPENVDQAWKAAEAQNADPAAQSYSRKWVPAGAIWNDNGVQRRVTMPEEKALLECVTAVFPAPQSARLVFALDEKGVVTRAFSDQTGYSAECIQSRLPGHRVPPPPKAPFYLCTQYTKRGDSGSVTTGCGPRPLSTSCERKGTTSTCSVYQR